MEEKEISGNLIEFATHMKVAAMINTNENYNNRLHEAYLKLKSNNVNSYELFLEKNFGIGAFTYYELTFFDKINNPEYKSTVMNCMFDIFEGKKAAEAKVDYGDRLASWGTIGNTPYRQAMIDRGDIVEGLTPEETTRHYR